MSSETQDPLPILPGTDSPTRLVPVAEPPRPITFAIPDLLDGRDGSNRSRSGTCQLNASNDIEAVSAWLAEYADTPHTLRSYRKEVERLLLWATRARGKALSSLTREDLLAYEAFLADPGAEWMSRELPRHGSNRRLFERALSAGLAMDAVTLRVGDLEQMSGYYENALALTPIEERARGAEVHRVLGRGDVPMVRLIHTPGLPGVNPREAGLFHTAFLFDDAAGLAATVYRTARDPRSRFAGSSDHLVSEAFYFHDPEGNGLELYRDRPREQWTFAPDGSPQMGSELLDPNAYLRTQAAWRNGLDPQPFGAFARKLSEWVGELGLPLVLVMVAVLIAISLSRPVQRLGPELQAWGGSYLVYILAVGDLGSPVLRFALLSITVPLGLVAWSRRRWVQVSMVVLLLMLQMVWIVRIWVFDGVGDAFPP